MCILFLYSLLKVVSHYDLSVLSMSVMGFQKSLYGAQSIFLEFLNFAKPTRVYF